jgi:DNA-binding transcriptional MerR regulator
VEYRVEDLAAAAGVSVDTVRYYQTKGLLPPPKRQGRTAVYSTDHLRRLKRIRVLQNQGLNLSVIGRVLEGRLSRADADLAAAVAAAEVEGEEEFLTIEELARRSGVPSALLRAVQRAGLALGRRIDGEERFASADVEVVRLALRLVETGLPIDALLEIGQRYHDAATAVADRAVELFDQHVRDPIRADAASDQDAAERLVAAFRELLPAVTTIVAHHFRRLLLRTAMEHIERVGDDAEIAASREEARRLHEGAVG